MVIAVEKDSQFTIGGCRAVILDKKANRNVAGAVVAAKLKKLVVSDLAVFSAVSGIKFSANYGGIC